MTSEYLGKLIVELRKKNNMSQKELAERLEVTSSNLSKWEHGQLTPSISALNKIAELFQISGDDLLHPETTLQRMQQPKDNVVTTPQPSVEKKYSCIPKKAFTLPIVFVTVLLLFGCLLMHLFFQPRFEVIDSCYDYNGTYGIHYMMSVLYSGHTEYEDFENFAETMRMKWINHEFAENADAIEFRFYKSQHDAKTWSETDTYIIIL